MAPMRLLGLILLVTGVIALVVSVFRESNRIHEIIPKPWLWVVIAALVIIGAALLILGRGGASTP